MKTTQATSEKLVVGSSMDPTRHVVAGTASTSRRARSRSRSRTIPYPVDPPPADPRPRPSPDSPGRAPTVMELRDDVAHQRIEIAQLRVENRLLRSQAEVFAALLREYEQRFERQEDLLLWWDTHINRR